jgi:hypothetical protein
VEVKLMLRIIKMFKFMAEVKFLRHVLCCAWFDKMKNEDLLRDPGMYSVYGCVEQNCQ